jgi:hypothetical protein
VSAQAKPISEVVKDFEQSLGNLRPSTKRVYVAGARAAIRAASLELWQSPSTTDLCCIVPAAGHQPVVIRADRHRIDRALVATQYHGVSRRIFCAQIPQTRCIVQAAGHPKGLTVVPSLLHQMEHEILFPFVSLTQILEELPNLTDQEREELLALLLEWNATSEIEKTPELLGLLRASNADAPTVARVASTSAATCPSSVTSVLTKRAWPLAA